MRYELQIVTSEPSFPSAEELVADVRARGISQVMVAASGGFDDAQASPRLLVEEEGGARVLVGFERSEHARFLASSLLGAPEPLQARLDAGDREVLARACTAFRLSVSQAGQGPADGVRLLVQLADALIERGGGVLLDAQMQLLWGASRWKAERALGEVDVRRHVVIHAEPTEAGLWMHTHGLLKFDRPDLEIFGVAEAQVEAGAGLLNHFARSLASGGALRVGDEAVLPGGHRVRVERGGRPPHDFEGEALCLVDAPGPEPRTAPHHVALALQAFLRG